MRIPVKILGENQIRALERNIGETFRRSGVGKENEQIVLRKEQWPIVKRMLESTGEIKSINESSAVTIRAYNALIKNFGAARATPEGRMALISAVMSLYAADPAMGSRLIFVLNM